MEKTAFPLGRNCIPQGTAHLGICYLLSKWVWLISEWDNVYLAHCTQLIFKQFCISYLPLMKESILICSLCFRYLPNNSWIFIKWCIYTMLMTLRMENEVTMKSCLVVKLVLQWERHTVNKQLINRDIWNKIKPMKWHMTVPDVTHFIWILWESLSGRDIWPGTHWKKKLTKWWKISSSEVKGFWIWNKLTINENKKGKTIKKNKTG